MTALELFKFISDGNCEYHWGANEDVTLFVDIPIIAEFNKLIGSGIMDDGGIECVMKNGYFCFQMERICNYHDIDMTEIFDSNK